MRRLILVLLVGSLLFGCADESLEDRVEELKEKLENTDSVLSEVDARTATVMFDAIEVELERLGFKAVEQATGYDGPGLVLVARRDGMKVSREEEGMELPQAKRFFLIRCKQLPPGNRLAHDPSNGYLALKIDVQWPYKRAGDRDGRIVEVEESKREHFEYPTAITR